jgi:pyruvate,water dikinase
VVAREVGIPAVVGIPGVLDAVRDGEQLRVDGTVGEVIRLDSKKEG